MADNLCGPSDALQNFQKHSNVDRTLQQDRLIGRASSSKGFRTTPGPNAGQLDAEFEAFQAGHQSLSPSSKVHNFSPRHFQTSSPRSFQNGSPQNLAGQDWATDFQNLNISRPQAQSPQQTLHQTHQQMGGWHQEFAQSYGGSELIGKGKRPSIGMNIPPKINPGYNSIPRVLMQQNQFTSTGQSTAQHQEAFDDAAFARAFDEAANAELEREREREQELEIAKSQHEDTIMMKQIQADQNALERDRVAKNLLNQAPLGADTIQDPSTATPDQNTDEPDALSRTAGELLHNVSNDQSDKFQNSQFLHLMRQFRDKEVIVEGDKVVEIKAKQGVYGDENGEVHDMLGAPRAE